MDFEYRLLLFGIVTIVGSLLVLYMAIFRPQVVRQHWLFASWIFRWGSIGWGRVASRFTLVASGILGLVMGLAAVNQVLQLVSGSVVGLAFWASMLGIVAVAIHDFWPWREKKTPDNALVLNRANTSKDAADEEKSDWTMIDWTDEAGIKILQSRDRRPSDARTRFTIAVVVEWRYGIDGIPDPPTMERIYKLEDALGAIRKEQSAIHVHTLTGNGVREWCYYTANCAAFESRFNEVVSGLSEMPIEISYQADPDWGYWRKTKSMALGKGA